jgi:hypothetical protein
MKPITNLVRLIRRIFLVKGEDHVSMATLKHYATLETKGGWEGPSYDGKFNR